MKKLCIIFSLLCLTTLNTFAREGFQRARVYRVYDGDTVQLGLESKPTSIRLVGIDCFEISKNYRAYKQAYEYNITIEEVLKRGNAAKEILNKIIADDGNEVYFKCTGVDKYGRLLGSIYTKNHKDINTIMLNSGYCPRYVFIKR